MDKGEAFGDVGIADTVFVEGPAFPSGVFAETHAVLEAA